MDKPLTRLRGMTEIETYVTEKRLHLPEGHMLISLRAWDPDDLNLIAFTQPGEGIVVLFPIVDEGVLRYDAMIYVAETSRKTGLAEKLVKIALLWAARKNMIFFPWDMGSGLFFNKMVTKGVLNYSHFLPEGLRCMEQADRLRQKYTVQTGDRWFQSLNF